MSASRLLGPQSPLRALKFQRRLQPGPLKVLVPVDGYYAQKESCEALTALGHTVVRVVLGEKGNSGPMPANVQKILTAVVQHRPDMLLSINYSGFDRANVMGELLEGMGLPTAVWFVDHPIVLALGWLPPTATCMSFFLWDRSFVPALRKFGAERLFYLPLGTDAGVFTPAGGQKGPVQPVGFVGHSLVKLERKWRQDLSAQEQATAEEMAGRLQQDRHVLHHLFERFERPVDRNAMVLAFACVLASKAYRAHLLEQLPRRSLHITGDAPWQTLLPGATFHPSTDYGAQSAQVYRNTQVAVNATNLQMPSTVNQRLFDVPACGGFLITDHQAEMPELFELGHGKEMLTYGSPDELRELVAYYLKRPQLRQAMAERARERVLGQHTYTHRLQTLLERMREQHASLPLGAVASPAAAPTQPAAP